MTQIAKTGTDDGIAPLSQRYRTTDGYPNDDAYVTQTSPSTTCPGDLSVSAGASPHDSPMSYKLYERYKQDESTELSEQSERYERYKRSKPYEPYERTDQNEGVLG